MMNFALVRTRSTVGIQAKPVSVEVHLSNGLPSFTMVGLPEAAVRESKDRVRSAIINSQFEFPCRRITVNLAPAELPKTGAGFDLPIALGILAASAQIPSAPFETHEFVAELALNGQLRGVSAIIPIVLGVYTDEKQLIIASDNAEEAAMTGLNHVHLAQNLREICSYLCYNQPLGKLPPYQPPLNQSESELDWSDVKGQEHAKYALEIAASGGHSVLMHGSPGSGKTMLARRLMTILPQLTNEQALTCAALYSLRGKKPEGLWRQPPFRTPHHTASMVALTGGGHPPRPGEISLAHHGVLFLDELPEFHRHVLETLREPMESGQICISRASQQVEFPAQFQLIAAMNPCPCGHSGSVNAVCVCSAERVHRYLSKLSGPLLDRIDIHLNVRALTEEELLSPNTQSQGLSEMVRKRVQEVQLTQLERQGCLNAGLGAKDCEIQCQIEKTEHDFLQQTMKKIHLSARGYIRLLKVARTIADYEQKEKVGVNALQQALSFRQMIQLPK